MQILVMISLLSAQTLGSFNVEIVSICPPEIPISNIEQIAFEREQLVADLHAAYLKGDYIETMDRYIDLAVFDEYEGGNAECMYDILAVFRDQEPFRKTWPNFVSSLANMDYVLLRRFFAEVPPDEISLFELRLLFQTSNEFYDDVHEETWMIEFINKLKAANRADELQQLTQVERGEWAENLRERAREALNALEQENAKIEE